MGVGHDYTVDWWALGILIYEMLIGIPPFFHKNKHRMYFLIKESQVTFPVQDKLGIEVSVKAKDLIRRLLEKNRLRRLGAKSDYQEVLQHPFFQGVDIQKIKNKTVPAPYHPEINDDLKYFDQKLVTKQEKDFAESLVNDKHKKLILKNQHKFDGF